MKILFQLIYEYQKEMRDLCLYTCPNSLRDKIEKLLNKQKIDYVIYEVESGKINIFFGKKECLEILKSFSHKELNLLNNHEDFILGIMLGYGKTQQYQRFINRQSLNVTKV